MILSATTPFPPQPRLFQRASPRVFDANRSLDPDLLLTFLDAARHPHHSSDLQTWRFIIAERRNEVGFRTMLNLLNSANQRCSRSAPVLLMVVARTLNETGDVYRSGGQEAGIALANLTLQAITSGLSVSPMAGFDPERARSTYGIPTGYDPITISAIGYDVSADPRPDTLLTHAAPLHDTLSLTQLIFEGQFGHSASCVQRRTLLMETL